MRRAMAAMIIWALGLVACDPCCNSCPVDPTGREQFGISMPDGSACQWGIGKAQREAMFEKATEAGFGWIRLYLQMDQVSSPDGTYAWGCYADQIEEAHAHGLKIQVVLGSYVFPEDTPTFVAFAKAAVLRFRPIVAAWELYQEPNWMAPADYQNKILIPGFDAIREVDAAVPIVAPGLVGSSSVEQYVMTPESNFTEMTRPLAAITIHLYGSPDEVIAEVARVNRDFAGRNFWLEEFGYGTDKLRCQPHPRLQTWEPEDPSIATIRVMEAVKQASVFEKIIYWDLYGEGATECDRGLFGNGGALKTERYCAIKRYLHRETGRVVAESDPCYLPTCTAPSIGVQGPCPTDVAGWSRTPSLDYISCCSAPGCGELGGGAICEHGGNGACGGVGARTRDCDHCCGGSLPTCGEAAGTTCETQLRRCAGHELRASSDCTFCCGQLSQVQTGARMCEPPGAAAAWDPLRTTAITCAAHRCCRLVGS